MPPANDVRSTATTARLFNWRAGVYFNVWFVAGSRRRTHPILYLCSHRYECLLNVGRTFCARFKEWDAQLVGILLQYNQQYRPSLNCFKLQLVKSLRYPPSTIYTQ